MCYKKNIKMNIHNIYINAGILNYLFEEICDIYLFLIISVGPTVFIRSKQISVRRGDPVTLRCEGHGDEPLDVTWRSRGHLIDGTYDLRYNLKTSPLTNGVAAELTISQSQLSDRGEFSCLATNTYGADHAVVSLQIQEPPQHPRHLRATELGSRSVVLAWIMPDSDSIENGPEDAHLISNYVLQFKDANDVWPTPQQQDTQNTKDHQLELPGGRTTTVLLGLYPATDYHVRIFAENHLGMSAPSDVLFIKTESEIPGGAPTSVTVEPLGAQQLLVTWRPPERSTWNGDLLGYIIGYRQVVDGISSSSDETNSKLFNYTRVALAMNNENGGSSATSDFRLVGLDKFTEYKVNVAAFNAKGDGPASVAISAHTLEDVPSAAPQFITCQMLTSQSLQVSWQPPSRNSSHGIIQGYKLLYEAAADPTMSLSSLSPSSLATNINDDTMVQSREIKITAYEQIVLYGLQPFTNYSIQLLAYTRAGDGILSVVTVCRTDETVPDAPARIKAIVYSSSSVIISWLPPRRQNGIVQRYTVFIRVLEKGQELKIIKVRISNKLLSFPCLSNYFHRIRLELVIITTKPKI